MMKQLDWKQYVTAVVSGEYLDGEQNDEFSASTFSPQVYHTQFSVRKLRMLPCRIGYKWRNVKHLATLFLHPASAMGVIVLTSWVCECVTTLLDKRTDIRAWNSACGSDGRICRSSSKVKVTRSKNVLRATAQGVIKAYAFLDNSLRTARWCLLAFPLRTTVRKWVNRYEL